jgi:putative phosphoribosyl transferase
MYFEDRIDAARKLAHELRAHAGARPLVLAIARGAVPMGQEIARELRGDLDVVLVRKLRAPHQPERAIGAIDESGWSFVTGDAVAVGADQEYLESEKREQLEIMRQRRARYTPWRRNFDAQGRVAIVVDDGLATGSTMIAALYSVRLHSPKLLVCAVPVAALESLGRVRPLADEFVCLHAPALFGALGAFYREFNQVSDDEVVEILSMPPASTQA